MFMLGKIVALALFCSLAVNGNSSGSPICEINIAKMKHGMGGDNEDLGYRLNLTATTYEPNVAIPFELVGKEPYYKGILIYVEPKEKKNSKVNSILTNANAEEKSIPQTFLWTPKEAYGEVSVNVLIVGHGMKNWQVLPPITLTPK